LWSGYLLFGLVFTYHIHSHDYYSLQLIPTVALSLTPLGYLAVSYASMVLGARWYRQVVALGILCLAGILAVVAAIANIREAEMRSSNSVDLESKVKMYEEVGQIVDHNSNTLFSAPDYGIPLKYHGWISGAAWSNEWDIPIEQLAGMPSVTIQDRYDALTTGYSPEYFVVVRDFRHFEEQKDLKDFLASKFSTVAQGEDYWIFDLGEEEWKE
jgi:hypothetical protein